MTTAVLLTSQREKPQTLQTKPPTGNFLPLYSGAFFRKIPSSRVFRHLASRARQRCVAVTTRYVVSSAQPGFRARAWPPGCGDARPDRPHRRDRAVRATQTVSCAKPTSGEVLPFARADALSPCFAAFDGRKTRDHRFSWATSSFQDAVGCRSSTRAPGQHRCAVYASVWPWRGVRLNGADYAHEKRPTCMHV